MSVEYCIETRDKETRDKIIEKIGKFGSVCNRWEDMSFNFKVYREMEDDFVDFMESEFPHIVYGLVG